jgi:hypothetical protein
VVVCVCLRVWCCSLVADAWLLSPYMVGVRQAPLASEPGRFLLCFVVPWWFPCRVQAGQGHFSIEEELLDRGGAISAGRRGDGDQV